MVADTWGSEVKIMVPLSLAKMIRTALTECAEDLETEISGRYKGRLSNPTEKRRYDNDRKPVVDALYCVDALNEIIGT